MDPQSDPPALAAEQLLARCASGDRTAFRDLYRRFSPSAHGLALRVLRDEQLAQDVVQEAFLQVWSQADEYDATLSSARGWVLGRVHRRAVDRVRREQVDHRNRVAWGIRNLDTEHDSVAEVIEIRSEHRRIRSALGALSGIQREALELAYFAGMTQSQIAEHLGIPLGTVKTRLRDGLIRLRQELEVTR